MFECQKKTYTPVLSISSLFPNICSANWEQKSQVMKERQLCYRKVRRISSEYLINSRQERCRQGAPRSPWNTKNFPIFRPTKTQMNSPKMTTRTIPFCDIPWPKRREKKSKSWCEYTVRHWFFPIPSNVYSSGDWEKSMADPVSKL